MLEDLELVLGQLVDESRPVRSIGFSRLSDLPRPEVARFNSTWSGLSATRRLELVSMMVAQAEENIHLNFHAVLRECLSDADGQIRRLAIDGLWEDEKPSLIGRLIALLADDPVPDVRAAAATSLGRFVLLGALGEITEDAADQAESALRVAWASAHESNEVRRRTLESLAYAADPVVSDLIETAYDDDDELVRQSAVFAMGRNADRRWSKPILTELWSRDPAMRYAAAVSAGELGLAEAVEPLVQLLDDADGNAREAAALALGKIGGREAKRALEEALLGEDERLTQAAEDALDELAFNSGSTGLESPWDDSRGRTEDHGARSRQRRVLEGSEAEEGIDVEAETEEDEDAWDAEEDEAPYWLDEDDDEDFSPGEDSHRGADSFPGLPRGWRGRSGPA
jgi:hypothetical protein